MALAGAEEFPWSHNHNPVPGASEIPQAPREKETGSPESTPRMVIYRRLLMVPKFFYIYINLFIYLFSFFLAALGLCCGARASR